jgi:hypothetical protein
MADQCDNCGREGTLTFVKEVVLSERSTEVVYEPGGKEKTADQTILHVQRCSVCEAPTLSTYRYIDGWSDPIDYMHFERIYPPKLNLDDLPPRVRDRYESLLGLLHAPDAFAVRAGRLLEAVCTDQGVAEGDLGPRLDQLAGKKHQAIPRGLADQAHLVRQFRNLGGHDDDVEVQPDDVQLIRGFVEALLEFLYWGPGKLERSRAALAARIKKSESSHTF